jgi:hypothetical protein
MNLYLVYILQDREKKLFPKDQDTATTKNSNFGSIPCKGKNALHKNHLSSSIVKDNGPLLT